ncbi:UNVERIFIED_CONTAM: hypothetical protein Sradi_3179000 [Sesamum radiatum]|uniref:Aminotransferase-like plant mobile domain-containing protein n=1 Tax=Sesamum radiatum TaxID=300843 RepID=A0AAW2REI0_SESRA
MPNSFFRIATLLPSRLHEGLLNPGMAKYPFTPAIGNGLKTCLATMRTSFMPPRSTPQYTHLFHGPLRYAAPPLRSSQKTVHEPKLSRNPSGDVDASNLPRAKDHDEPFTILQIPKDIRDETYVAAFVSCWLCNFVLPQNKVGKVRALTFKVASRMAHGECFSLAIPVLASIYRGPSLVANDAKISNTFQDLFMALRSSYLTLRVGGDSVVEAYSPHHFSRQFSFCQDVSGSLKKEILTCSLKELGRLWQSCTLSGVSVTPEGSIGSVNRISTSDFPIVDAVLNGKLQPISIDDHLSIETPSKRPKIMLPAIMEKPLLVENVLEKPKKTFEAPSWPYSSTEVNDFCPQLIKTEAEQMLLKFYWERICQKIMTTPIE